MATSAVLLAPRVYRIPTMRDFINSYAFVDDDGQVTLVDTGLKRAPKKIVEGLASIGKHPHDVTRIILTHAHNDHAGGAHHMVQVTDVHGVSVHVDDAEYIRKGVRPPIETTSAGRIFNRLSKGGFAPTPVDAELRDGELIDVAGGIAIHHTPGHSPGHVSLLHEPSGVLITGDAIFNMNSKMRWPVAAFCTSFVQNQRSAHVLGELNYSIAAFTHGPEIRSNAREAIRGFLRKQA